MDESGKQGLAMPTCQTRGAGGILSPLSLPISPPETIGAGESFGLHDLSIVDVRLHIEGMLEVLDKVQLQESEVSAISFTPVRNRRQNRPRVVFRTHLPCYD